MRSAYAHTHAHVHRNMAGRQEHTHASMHASNAHAHTLILIQTLISVVLVKFIGFNGITFLVHAYSVLYIIFWYSHNFVIKDKCVAI